MECCWEIFSSWILVPLQFCAHRPLSTSPHSKATFPMTLKSPSLSFENEEQGSNKCQKSRKIKVMISCRSDPNVFSHRFDALSRDPLLSDPLFLGPKTPVAPSPMSYNTWDGRKLPKKKLKPKPPSSSCRIEVCELEENEDPWEQWRESAISHLALWFCGPSIQEIERQKRKKALLRNRQRHMRRYRHTMTINRFHYSKAPPKASILNVDRARRNSRSHSPSSSGMAANTQARNQWNPWETYELPPESQKDAGAVEDDAIYF